MRDDIETLIGARHGYLKVVSPRDYRSDKKEHSSDSTDLRGRRGRDSVDEGTVADRRDILLARARLVRNGIESVGKVCGLRPLGAVGALAREMGVPPAQVIAWAERGIKIEWLWKNWCKAGDALARPWRPEVTVEEARPHEALGNRLKAWRQGAGLSVAAAGRACGVRGCTYYKWEKGVTKPSAQRMPRLRELFAAAIHQDQEAPNDV